MKQIFLTNGQIALVDDEDYEAIRNIAWRRMSTYAIGTINKQKVLMHRLIIGATKGRIVDHINGNGLDNRRCNLRLCTHSENMRNCHRPPVGVSRYRGVSLDRRKTKAKWRAGISIHYRNIALGYFRNEEDAARAYDNAARRYHGEFATLNFKQDQSAC